MKEKLKKLSKEKSSLKKELEEANDLFFRIALANFNGHKIIDKNPSIRQLLPLVEKRMRRGNDMIYSLMFNFEEAGNPHTFDEAHFKLDGFLHKLECYHGIDDLELSVPRSGNYSYNIGAQLWTSTRKLASEEFYQNLCELIEKDVQCGFRILFSHSKEKKYPNIVDFNMRIGDYIQVNFDLEREDHIPYKNELKQFQKAVYTPEDFQTQFLPAFLDLFRREKR